MPASNNKLFDQKMRVAGIDLGTNTFHLLIVEKEENGFQEIHRDRQWVSLAEDGIGHFSNQALERAWKTIQKFRKTLDQYKITDYRAIGTAAFRSADNGKIFLEKVSEDLGIKVEIISGSREAELIYKGTELVAPGTEEYQLIMDIGGGSTEFILYNKDGIKWSNSYQAGVTYLFNLVKPEDPISDHNIKALVNYFAKTFFDFPRLEKDEKIKSLIGASGSFEVLEMLHRLSARKNKTNQISLLQFQKSFDEFLPTSCGQRIDHPLIPNSRAKLIVIAFLLIHFIVKKTNPQNIKISPYALKEGVIRELLKI